MKQLLLIIGMATIIGLAGCGSESQAPAEKVTTEAKQETETWSSWEYEGVSMDIPDSWKHDDSDETEGSIFFYPDDGMLMISYQDDIDVSKMNADNMKDYVEGMESDENLSVESMEPCNIAEYSAYKMEGTYNNDGNLRPMKWFLVSVGGKAYAFAIDSSEKGEYDAQLEQIISSIRPLEESPEATTEEATTEEATTEATTEVTTEPEPEETTEAEPEATTGQLNALDKALDYLDYTAFSKKGLRSQLEYEGFKDDEIDYAIENCGADWKEQAVKKAEEYLDFTSFSKEGLIDQLEYDGFTEKQAKYGADKAYK